MIVPCAHDPSSHSFSLYPNEELFILYSYAESPKIEKKAEGVYTCEKERLYIKV